MLVKYYDEMKITVLSQSQNPDALVKSALNTCMKKDISHEDKVDNKTVKYLLGAEHTSPLEHATMTIYVEGISRSLLAQLTRQRTFSFTSASQHYQNYSDYPVVISRQYFVEQHPHMQLMMLKNLNNSLDVYNSLIEKGMPKEEARQVLPNASAVNLQITADARNMANFFRQRRCMRNVEEMVIFADLWWASAIEWFPQLFSLVGAPCFMDSACNQGVMKAECCK